MSSVKAQAMFRVEKMSPEDHEFAARLSNTMGWDASEDDFEFMAKLEPKGCFTLFSGSERVGIATAVSFGNVGWLGNVIVSEEHRGKGGGSLLVQKAIEYLTSRGVETIGLYGYTGRVHFYERHGFRLDSRFVVMKGKGFVETAKPRVRAAAADDEHSIIELDGSCFGGSRSRLLEFILRDPANLCYVSTDDGELLGFVVAKVYDETSEIGPLVCRGSQSGVATDLLKKILGKLKGCEVYMCVPEKDAAILNLLRQHRFKEHLVLARMFRGTPTVNDYVYVAESLERG